METAVGGSLSANIIVSRQNSLRFGSIYLWQHVNYQCNNYLRKLRATLLRQIEYFSFPSTVSENYGRWASHFLSKWYISSLQRNQAQSDVWVFGPIAFRLDVVSFYVVFCVSEIESFLEICDWLKGVFKVLGMLHVEMRNNVTKRDSKLLWLFRDYFSKFVSAKWMAFCFYENEKCLDTKIWNDREKFFFFHRGLVEESQTMIGIVAQRILKV